MEALGEKLNFGHELVEECRALKFQRYILRKCAVTWEADVKVYRL